jgi:D-psicose/D-tagatose/L-ribulose 3-epimerase
MKFGIHSLLFSETFTERDLPLLDKAKAMGFDAVDIVPFDIDNFPAKLVRRRAADLGLDIMGRRKFSHRSRLHAYACA